MTEEQFLQRLAICLPHWEQHVGRQSDGQCQVVPHETRLPEEPHVKRFYLQAVIRFTRYNPLNIVAWIWCSRWLDVSNERALAETLRLDERTMKRLSDAIWHRKGYDYRLREQLFTILGIHDLRYLRYLEPTTK